MATSRVGHHGSMRGHIVLESPGNLPGKGRMERRDVEALGSGATGAPALSDSAMRAVELLAAAQRDGRLEARGASGLPTDPSLLGRASGVPDKDSTASGSRLEEEAPTKSCWQSFVDVMEKVWKAVADFFCMIFCIDTRTNIEKADARLQQIDAEFTAIYEEAVAKAKDSHEDGLNSDNINTYCNKGVLKRLKEEMADIAKQFHPPATERGEILDASLDSESMEFQTKVAPKYTALFNALGEILNVCDRSTTVGAAPKLDFPDTAAALKELNAPLTSPGLPQRG